MAHPQTEHKDGSRNGTATDSELATSGNRPRVLVAEDDLLIAMQAEAALSGAGFEVVGPATTAEEVVDLAARTRPRLVVMDVRLAGSRDGIDAAGEIFQRLGIRCIFATAHCDVLTRQRAEACAPLGWLQKPYSPAALIRLVSDVLPGSGRHAGTDGAQ